MTLYATSFDLDMNVPIKQLLDARYDLSLGAYRLNPNRELFTSRPARRAGRRRATRIPGPKAFSFNHPPTECYFKKDMKALGVFRAQS